MSANLVTRSILTGVVILGVSFANTVHETVSPLVSGPMAAQQLTDSNAAYVGTQIVSRAFNGDGFNGTYLSIAVLAALIAIWYRPMVNLFRTNEKV